MMPAGVKVLLKNIDSAIEQAADRSLAEGFIPYVVDEDFPIGEKPFMDLSEEEVTEIGDITGRRLIGLGWLFGKVDWDTKPEDVPYHQQFPSVWAPDENE